MSSSIYYLKITESKDESINTNAFKVFILMMKQFGGQHILFAECTDKIDVFYLIWNKEKTLNLIRDFKNTGIDIEFEELTESVINGYYNMLFQETFSSEKGEEILFEFLDNNISIDALLDKIINSDIDSLTVIERNFITHTILKNEKYK